VSSLLEVGTGFHPELTGRENVFLNGAILGMFRAEILRKFDAIVAFAELEQFIDTPVKHYSSGMFVRLAFSVAAHLEPEILIVDEVLSVGDLHFRNRCLGRMQDLRDEGRTVLFVSHDLTSVRQLCTRALMLNGGHLVDDGTPSEITRRYERMYQDSSNNTSGAADRAHPPRDYHLRRVELRNAAGAISGHYDAGDVVDIHLWSSGRAPENSYTAEFKLLNSDDRVISFGSANPVRDTYFLAEHQHFVCRLGPLPLTEGAYAFSFTVGVWNKERWDFWAKAIGFTVGRCDLFATGHGISNVNDGDFVIQQEWLARD
jgi:lipopolysaccharide transport system ATP-binding protein